MEKKPKITVIIPCYNVERHIEGTLESLISQTYSNIDIICLDDFSKDKTYELIQKAAQKDSRIKYYQNEHNLGVVRTLNKLIDLSTSDFILRMDSDDVFECNRIEKMYEAMLKFDCDIVSTEYSVIDEKGDFVKHKGLSLPSHSDSLKFVAMFNSPLPSQALFNRRRIGEKMAYSDKYAVAEDYYMFVNLFSDESIMAYNVPKKLYRYRINTDGLTNNNLVVMNEYHILIAREYIHNILRINAESFDFWKLGKRMIDYSTISREALSKSLKQIKLLKDSFLDKYRVADIEKKEIEYYYGQYLTYTYFCIFRDAFRQKALLKILPVIMNDAVSNSKNIFTVKNFKWLWKNI